MSIIVGYLPTPEGHAALDRALEEARLRASNVVIVNRSSSAAASEGEPAQDEKVAQVLADASVAAEVIDPADDEDPAESLIAAAEQHDGELIVIGLRKRNPVGKLILGANAQRILLDAGCPVLAVKSPGPAA
ncbi:universal stress protein [Saxibacter everestensis]|uniref:Universal stress protein n=1 Tax=Saxibacter everestensis TaxID=2909229 RepID=A0ABY8QYJ5_9MICO|nr:universal stress protein [Brevibacteriaceae bacterium ZFBP1038]